MSVLPVYVYVHCVHNLVPVELADIGVMTVLSHHVVLEIKSGFSGRAPVLLTSEPSVQPSPPYLLVCLGFGVFFF